MYNSSISGIFRLFIVISLISLFVGCGGGGGGSSTPGGNTASSPTITSLTPTSGQVGDTVTITGTNFSTTLANNTVSFNGQTPLYPVAHPPRSSLTCLWALQAGL